MKTNLKPWLLVGLALLIGACGLGPERFTERDFNQRWIDGNTEYRVDAHATGFTVTSYTSEFQMVPDRTAVLLACKSAILAIAHDAADKRARKLQPVNEQRIRISLGRLLSNGVSGVTACSAQLTVEYAP